MKNCRSKENTIGDIVKTTRFTAEWLIIPPKVPACQLKGITKLAAETVSRQIDDQFYGNKLYRPCYKTILKANAK